MSERTHLFDDASKHVDRFGALLLVTVAATITLALFDIREPGGGVRAEFGTAIVTFFVGAMFVLSLQASGVARRWRRIAGVIVTVALGSVLLVLILEFFGSDAPAVAVFRYSPVWLFLAGAAPIAVIRRLIHHRKATLQTLLGALSAYLLIAVAFDFAFMAVSQIGTTPFFGTEQPSTVFMYFSLTTITTLGYGDFSAATELGRLLATIEAVVGQVYLVTFVAMIVGLLAEQRATERNRRAAAEGLEP